MLIVVPWPRMSLLDANTADAANGAVPANLAADFPFNE